MHPQYGLSLGSERKLRLREDPQEFPNSVSGEVGGEVSVRVIAVDVHRSLSNSSLSTDQFSASA